MQLRELNGVEHHRIMKQSAWDHHLGDSPLRGVFKAVNHETLRGKRRGWMQSAKFLTLARGGENISLDIPFYRILFSPAIWLLGGVSLGQVTAPRRFPPVS